MGKQGTYRWERRKVRNQRRDDNRTFQAFWGFELFLVFLIFFADFIGIRFAVPYILSLTTCQEMFSSFGSSPGLGSIFDMLFRILLLSLGLWVGITIAFRDLIWKSKTGILHMALFVGLIVSAGLSNSMRMDAPPLPDGVLVADVLRDGQTLNEVGQRYRSFYGFGHRVSAYNHPDLAYRTSPKSCVWLDAGLIEDNTIAIDIGPEVFDYFERPGFKFITVEHLKGMFTKNTFAEQIADNQVFRPLTENERADFIAKQKCRKALGPEIGRYPECDYVWYDPLYSNSIQLTDPFLIPDTAPANLDPSRLRP